ncbi:hypothetical protein [Pedobacter endophyticus]|uniref:Uncharacterized protein n=1 Tax=Pedobacter endophyticus TaxID=2789740 RepID=A0A7S9Q065_9SPHI|nr:hypothetical protein [Pedobacter endophyticus]QPH40372.1 hypothetical protein IZT61_03580 [Pedobacter endophyticus]
MEIHTSKKDSSNLQTESANKAPSGQQSGLANEGIERISQALWKVINAQIAENDASLWKMWR